MKTKALTVAAIVAASFVAGYQTRDAMNPTLREIHDHIDDLRCTVVELFEFMDGDVPDWYKSEVESVYDAVIELREEVRSKL